MPDGAPEDRRKVQELSLSHFYISIKLEKWKKLTQLRHW